MKVTEATAPGTAIYCEKGYVYVLIKVTPLGVIAQRLIESGAEEPYKASELSFLKVSFLKEAYTEPVVAKVAEQIAEIEDEKQKAAIELGAINTAIIWAKKTLANAMARVKGIAAIEGIFDFIDGKITHFVLDDGYGSIQVKTFKEQMSCDSDSDSYRKNSNRFERLKLLTLFGDSKGNLGWQLNRYRDGSGIYIDVWPCASFEQAIAKVTELCNAKFEEWKKNKYEHMLIDDTVMTAKKYNITIPEEIAKAYAEKMIDRYREQVAYAKRTLQQSKEHLEKVELELKSALEASKGAASV